MNLSSNNMWCWQNRQTHKARGSAFSKVIYTNCHGSTYFCSNGMHIVAQTQIETGIPQFPEAVPSKNRDKNWCPEWNWSCAIAKRVKKLKM